LPAVSAGAGIPVIAMRDLVLFPQMTLSIFVARDDTRRGVEFAMAGDRRVLMVAQRRDVDNDPNTLESLYPVGVTASVINRQTQVDGVLKVSISGLQRAAIVRLANDEFLAAEIVPIKEGRGQSAKAVDLSRTVLDAYQIYANVDFSSLPPGPRARHGLPSIGDPSLLADTVAPLLSIGIEKMQQLLETSDVVTRLEAILDLMNAGRPAK
jgi:ATP-dependent Lon protease